MQHAAKDAGGFRLAFVFTAAVHAVHAAVFTAARRGGRGAVFADVETGDGASGESLQQRLDLGRLDARDVDRDLLLAGLPLEHLDDVKHDRPLATDPHGLDAQNQHGVFRQMQRREVRVDQRVRVRSDQHDGGHGDDHCNDILHRTLLGPGSVSPGVRRTIEPRLLHSPFNPPAARRFHYLDPTGYTQRRENSRTSVCPPSPRRMPRGIPGPHSRRA